MKTVGIFTDLFTGRTTGRRATFTINALTLDAVKIVLKGNLIKIGTEGTEEDCKDGFLQRVNSTGYYGGNDGYKPTAKGFRAILASLQ